MSENLKTIKELADELGITKQTVQYHIKNLPSKIRKKNSRGAILLTKEEQNFIKSRVNKQSDREQFYLEKIKIQEEQIEDFKEQRIELREQVKHLGVLLDQQQRLALQDKKLLEEYKSEINELKSLKMPQEDKKENQSQEEVQTIKKQMEALNDKIKGQEQLNNQVSKKWYQFWK
ncbi:Replication-associated protein [Lactococcus lactis subsp. lactis]|uniref:helix-turn-helix transcriptional regulator n=1 Tax=Lactococcus lactis TaxID=1358 RepID=UPI00071E2887|nr:LuxR C-terminal-related transcriptional regulator [Lactococcus lactis]ARE09753.1 LuxR C-terminal-related transcriptional regulator [Lactococcus lactis subsp. lactis]KSU32154.1 Replication-associated protein [Lactococcus lactis subsp. lactis]URL07699.1 LuxR C-terminal-related transcriptional regulator [Lactococcus lactis subsp. lactis]